MTNPQTAAYLPSIPGFTIEKELGRGSMAVVYRATQLDPPRPVALKILRPQAGPDVLARLQAEAEALTRLRHPNVLEVYTVGEHAGRPYLVMEFCDDSSLDKHLLGQPQPPRVAARLTMTMARAVQYCHDQGIIHRDLKPANILLSGPTLKIADFGLAKLLDGDMNLTQSGAVLGSIGYMAPEQAKGATKHVGPAADIWALGCVLYALLTGDPPFHGMIDAESLTRMLEQEPPPPEGPPELAAVCLKCLRKKPTDRYASAGALADDLDRWRRGEPIAFETEPSPDPVAEKPGWFAGLWGRKSGD